MSLIVAPRAEPIHLDEAKSQARIDITEDDTRVERLIASARRYAEQHTRRAFVTQQRKYVLDGFPPVICLPASPLQRVAAIEYVDADGATQTLASSKYRVDAESDTPRITPAFGESWPITRDVVNAVTVKYWAGYATPFTADTATDTLTAKNHPYANGDRVSLYNSGGSLPSGLSADESYYVVGASGDNLQLSTSEGGSAVDITDVGSGTSFLGLVPDEIRHAMLLLVAHWYENREAVLVGTISTEIQFAVDSLLRMKSVDRF